VTAVSGGVTNGLYDFLARELPPTQSRWISPDPAGLAAVDPSDPQTWNRYAYVRNAPMTESDPLGLCDLIGGGVTQTPGTADTQQQEADADQLGANLVFPFSGEGLIGSLFSGMFGSAGQEAMYNAVVNTVNQSAGGPTNLYLFSGSAGVFAKVYPTLPANIQQGITSVTYVSPGNASFDSPLPLLQVMPPATPGGLPVATNVVTGNSLYSPLDKVVTETNGIPSFLDPGTILNCDHVANCLFSQLDLSQNSNACPNRQVFTRQHPAGIHGGAKSGPPFLNTAPDSGGGRGGAGGDPQGGSTTTIHYPGIDP
jgi:RHS repeat-associated protein